MQTGVIIGVVIYELVVILGCTFALSYMEKKKAALLYMKMGRPEVIRWTH